MLRPTSTFWDSNLQSHAETTIFRHSLRLICCRTISLWGFSPSRLSSSAFRRLIVGWVWYSFCRKTVGQDAPDVDSTGVTLQFIYTLDSLDPSAFMRVSSKGLGSQVTSSVGIRTRATPIKRNQECTERSLKIRRHRLPLFYISCLCFPDAKDQHGRPTCLASKRPAEPNPGLGSPQTGRLRSHPDAGSTNSWRNAAKRSQFRDSPTGHIAQTLHVCLQHPTAPFLRENLGRSYWASVDDDDSVAGRHNNVTGNGTDPRENKDTHPIHQKNRMKDWNFFLTHNPSFLTHNPSFLTHNPSFLTRNPSFLTRNPSFLTRNPSFVTHNPSFLTRNPFFLTHNPFFLTHNPFFLTHNPSFLTHNPSFLTHNPSFLTHNPSFLTHNPSFLTRNPSFLTHNPSFLTRNPFFLTHNPFFLTHNPSFLTHNPSFLTHNPSFLTRNLLF